MAAEPSRIDFDKDAVARLEALARRFGDKNRLRQIILKRFERGALLAAGEISRKMRGGGKLRRRSGSLARSITGKGELIGGLPGMRVGIFTGPSLAYAGIQEGGGTVKPKKPGGYLAVPTDDGGALTPAGVPRYRSARESPRPLSFVRGRFKGQLNGQTVGAGAALFREDQYKKAVRTVWETVHVPELRGFALNALLQRVRPVYLLLRRVKIKPKWYLRDGFAEALPSIVQDVESALLEELSRGE